MSYINGKFYILDDVCTGCSIAPESAPNCIKFQKYSNTEKLAAPCVLVKQPDSEEELNQVILAMKLSCVESIRYAGEDDNVLKKIRENNLTHLCD